MTPKHSDQDIDFLIKLFRLFFPFNSSTVSSSSDKIRQITNTLESYKLSFVYEFFKFYFGIDLRSYDSVSVDKCRDFKYTDENTKLANDLAKDIVDFLELDRVSSRTTNHCMDSRKRLKFVFGPNLSESKYSYRHSSYDPEERRKYDFRSQNQDEETDYKNIKTCLTEAIDASVKYGLDIWLTDWETLGQRSEIVKSKLFFHKFLLAVMCFADVNSGVSNKSKELEVFVYNYLKINKYCKSQEKLQDLAKCLVKVAKFFSSQFQKKANEQGLKTGRIYPDGSKTFDQMVGLRLHRVAQGPIIFDVFKDLICSRNVTLLLILKNKRIATRIKEKEPISQVVKRPKVVSSRASRVWTETTLLNGQPHPSSLSDALRPAPLPAPPQAANLRHVREARRSAQRNDPSQYPAVTAEFIKGREYMRRPNSVERVIYSPSAGVEARRVNVEDLKKNLAEKKRGKTPLTSSGSRVDQIAFHR